MNYSGEGIEISCSVAKGRSNWDSAQNLVGVFHLWYGFHLQKKIKRQSQIKNNMHKIKFMRLFGILDFLRIDFTI